MSDRLLWCRPNIRLIPVMGAACLFFPAVLLGSTTVPKEAFTASVRDGVAEISNAAIAARWGVVQGRIAPRGVTDRISGTEIAAQAELFTIVLDNGKSIRSSDLRVSDGPRIEELSADPRSGRLAERIPGRAIFAVLEDKEGNLRVSWRAVGRDGTRYLRQEITLEARKSEVPVHRIVLVDCPLRFPWQAGTARGVPVVSGGVFCAVEHPMADNEVEEGRAVCALERSVPLAPGQVFTCSSVIGVTRPGQLRRDFSEYLEKERAHPHRPFLHYNSWYDLGYFTPYDEKEAVAVIDAFGRELVQARRVVLDSFLFDDGWDDHRTIWSFNSGFPRGFAPLKEAAARYGAGPGVWMSPWGGYGEPRRQRLEFGRRQGFETNAQGLALSGPAYFAYFRKVCLEMVTRYGVNQFKFDGTGDATGRYPGSRFGSDFEAAIQLIRDLRAQKTDLYVNLTTGTWPSPFWLRDADSIWRDGDDHSFAGVGTRRQQWITYRDAQTFRNIVSPSPLFPLNSLMLHGIIYARHAKGLESDPQGDFGSEVRSYFGSGTQCQEMYVTPGLLSPANWDTLAEAARWARENAATLRDSHWVGGDPGKGEVYGWASWSPRKAILVLRNPSDRPASITLDPASAFELPAGAPGKFAGRSPWSGDRGNLPVELQAGQGRRFDLGPFQVLTIEALLESSG